MLYGISIIIGFFFANTQAAENVIPVHIYNNYWAEKTRLEVLVAYRSGDSFSSTYILNGLETEQKRTEINFTIPKSLIKSIDLFLRAYHENSVDGLEDTLLGTLTFHPVPSCVLEMSFVIDGSEIIGGIRYNLPPKFKG